MDRNEHLLRVELWLKDATFACQETQRLVKEISRNNPRLFEELFEVYNQLRILEYKLTEGKRELMDRGGVAEIRTEDDSPALFEKEQDMRECHRREWNG